VLEQQHCAVAVPERERIGLVLALTVRLLNLEDSVVARRGDQVGGDAAFEGLAEGPAPALCDQAGVGQR
jgi:hypothetical protein